jgi:hypothetical protein
MFLRIARGRIIMTRNNMRLTMATAALAGGIGASAALAQDSPSYPRWIGTGGESATIDYGPGPPGNTVGGGRTRTTLDGSDSHITYLDRDFVQRGRDGQRLVTYGSGEGAEAVWLPATPSLALVPSTTARRN